MIYKPTRSHWTSIIQEVFNSIKQFVVLLILMLSYRGKALYIGGAIILVIILAVAIKKWFNTVFYIKDNMLIFQSGIFAKSKQEIPFNKIHTIDIGKNLLDRIFDICTVKIDSGSAVSKGSDFKIKIKYELALELRENILGTEKNHINNGVVEETKKEKVIEKVITLKELTIYAVTKGKLAWAIGGYFALLNFADDIEKITNTAILDKILSYININDVISKDKVTIIISLIAVLVLSYIIITLLSIGFEIIRLYEFTIKAEDKHLKISYGIFSKKEYSIPIEKIHALKYKQSVIQQLLGIYTLEAITIGYGDEKGEKAILYPIANNKFKEEFLGKILPEMDFVGEVKKPPKKSLKRFIFKRTVIALIILIPLYFIIKAIPSEFKLTAISIIILVNMFLGYLNYKNASLGITEKTIIASSGSLTKTTTIIKQSSVQSISSTQTPFQRKDRVCDYKIDIYSNLLAEIVTVKHMNESLNNDLYENLIM